MREELFEEILSLVEEFINELDLNTMQSSNDKRKENWENSLDDYLKASKEGDEDTKEEENLKSLKVRNKLEKVFSNECFESLISLIEGELINFQEKRKQKVLDRNAEKMARMMQDGSLNAVRVLPNKELIGDPVAIKMVKDIQKENEEVINKARKKA